MLLNLILDGNYLLSKLVFTLHKNNLLYGALEQALEKSIENYKKMYPFHRIYLVSDSKQLSWRKKLNKKYKSTRKKDSDIDWKFVYDTYDSFKESRSYITVLESSGIEGDDWIALLCEKTNAKNESNFIVTNDHDIKQLVRLNTDDEWLNFMSNEMYNNKNVFMPKNYRILVSKIKQRPNDDIFNLNNDTEFIELIETLSKKYNMKEIDWQESLVIKLISGDRSDNVKSVYLNRMKNGKLRGIGEKGAEKIYENYQSEFGQIDINDPDMGENIGDIICEMKKLSKTKIQDISKRVAQNRKIIELKTAYFPEEIRETLEKKWKEINEI